MQFWDPDTGGMASRKGGVSASGSLFSMLRSPIDKTPITPLGMELERIRVYRSFNTGMDARARNGTGANLPKEFLDDGGDNLAAVLHEMRFDGSIERVNQYVRRLTYWLTRSMLPSNRISCRTAARLSPPSSRNSLGRSE